jgi:hypothetical protein
MPCQAENGGFLSLSQVAPDDDDDAQQAKGCECRIEEPKANRNKLPTPPTALTQQMSEPRD